MDTLAAPTTLSHRAARATLVEGSSPVFFRSGCSRAPKDFMAGVEAGVAVGVSTIDCTEGVLAMARNYLQSGGRVFNDSGAFGAFRRGAQLTDAEFNRHLDTSIGLAAAAQEGHLYAVAPDVVGDQDATVALLERHTAKLLSLAAAGAVVVVPLQRGGRSLADFYAYAQKLLAPFEVCAGLPFNLSALSSDEIVSFIQLVRPSRVHFLGAARAKRFQNLLAEVRNSSPTTRFSYDAAVVQQICEDLGLGLAGPSAPKLAATAPSFFEASDAVTGRLQRTESEMLFGLIPAKHNSRVAELLRRAEEFVESGQIDLTEISPYLNPGDDLAVQAAAITCGVSTATLRKSIATAAERSGSEDGDECEELLGAYWDGFAALYVRLLMKQQGRTRALAAHPVFNTDPHELGASQRMLAF